MEHWSSMYTYVLALAAFFVACENIIKFIVNLAKKAKSPADKNQQEHDELKNKYKDLDERLRAFEKPESVRKHVHDLRHRVDKLESNQVDDHNELVVMQKGINILLKCQLSNCSDESLRQEVTDYIIDK